MVAGNTVEKSSIPVSQLVHPKLIQSLAHRQAGQKIVIWAAKNKNGSWLQHPPGFFQYFFDIGDMFQDGVADCTVKICPWEWHIRPTCLD